MFQNALKIIRISLVWAWPFILKAFKWSIKPESRKFIARLFQYTGSFKKFIKTGDPRVLLQIAKEFSDMTKDMTAAEKKEEAKKVTDKSGPVKNLSIHLNTKKGVVVKAFGMQGNWNPKDGSGDFGLTL